MFARGRKIAIKVRLSNKDNHVDDNRLVNIYGSTNFLEIRSSSANN